MPTNGPSDMGKSKPFPILKNPPIVEATFQVNFATKSPMVPATAKEFVQNGVLAILRVELPRKFGRDGWNGYGAKAVLPKSERFAAEFVRTMPFDLEDPLVRAVPSGCVCFSWRAGKERLCSVVFDTDGKYHCASIIGAFESAITTNDANEVIRKAMEVWA